MNTYSFSNDCIQKFALYYFVSQNQKSVVHRHHHSKALNNSFGNKSSLKITLFWQREDSTTLSTSKDYTQQRSHLMEQEKYQK